MTGWRVCICCRRARSSAPSATRARDQILALVTLHGGHPGRTGERMPAVGQAGVQRLRLERPRDTGRKHHGAERHVRTGQALGERHQVRARLVAVALPREPFAAAAEAAHDLIRDQVDAARAGAVAQRGPEVSGATMPLVPALGSISTAAIESAPRCVDHRRDAVPPPATPHPRRRPCLKGQR